ncbi:MAG TPA: hypothetical protein DEW39_08955 [Brevibacterium sp.]|nr:hypothetical protein [Brevibacterium sp.]
MPSAIPGAPRNEPPGDAGDYVCGLSEAYAIDRQFRVNEGGLEGALLVRDSLRSCFDQVKDRSD